MTTFEIDVGEGETRTIRFGVPPTELPFWDKFDAALAHVRSIVDVGRPISNPPEVNVLPPNSAPANPRRESSESTPSSGDHDHDHDHDDVEASAAKVERRIGRLCQAFNLSRLEIRSVYHAELSRLLYNATGVLGIGEQGVFFYARRPTGDVKVRISAHDIREAKPASSIRFSTFGLRLLVRGHDDINFDFHDRTKRDRAIADIEALVEASPTVAGPTSATTPLRESPFGMIGRTPKRSETLSGQAMDDWIVESPVTPLDVPPCATSMMPLAVVRSVSLAAREVKRLTANRILRWETYWRPR